MSDKTNLSTLIDYCDTRDEAMKFINRLKRSNPSYRFRIERDRSGDYRIYTSGKIGKEVQEKYGV